MFVPYIWLDNGLSFATGREGLGWPKAWGWPGFPTAKDDPFTLDVFGWDFGEDHHPERHRLLELAPGPSAAAAGKAFGGFRDIVTHFREVFEGGDGGAERESIGLKLAEQLLSDAVHATLPELFLKQLHSPTPGQAPEVQEIVQSGA